MMARDIKNKTYQTAPIAVMGVVIIGLAGCSEVEFISYATKKSSQYAANKSTPYVLDHTVSNRTEAELATRYGYRIGKPYIIKGQRIVPAENFNYSQVGMASWYGGKFHGRKTANGEIFNKHALTAAHPTLPMPSIVRVTNLENGRSIRLRINDRGPFLKGRIIDVSKAAANGLGFVGKGVARVRVDIIASESKALKQAAAQFDKLKPTPVVQAQPTSAAVQQHQQPVYTPARPTSPSLGYGYQPSMTTVPRPTPIMTQSPIQASPVQQWPQQIQPNYAPPPQSSSKSPLPYSAQISQPNSVFLNSNDHKLSPTQTQPTNKNPIAYGNHVIQVGAFSLRENAVRLQNNLSSYGQFNISQIVWDDKALYRVRSKKINSRIEAEQLAQHLASKGLGTPQVITE